MFILFQFLKLLVFFPVNFQLKIGSLIGYLIFNFASNRKKIIRKNLKTCFPKQSESEINRLLYLNCINMGKGLIEVAMTFYLSSTRLKKISQIKGLENIKKAKKENKGIIFLPAHFTSMFLAGRILHLNEPLTLIYYSQNNPKFAKEMEAGFKRHQFKAIVNRNIRAMIKALNEKQSLWLPCDQDYGEMSSIYSTLFKQKAATIITPAKIGKNRKVSYLPVRYKRKNNHYELTIEPEMQNYPAEDDQKNADLFNQMIEKQIKQNLEQYLWAHKRFKTQPKFDNLTQNFYS